MSCSKRHTWENSDRDLEVASRRARFEFVGTAMNDTNTVPMSQSEPTAASGAPIVATASPRRSLLGRSMRFVLHSIPSLVALAALTGLIVAGQCIGWKLPKFSALVGGERNDKDDWCEAHGVPDSICVECRKECKIAEKSFGWCKLHGVSECPLCHPEIAQLPYLPAITSADLERAKSAMKFTHREGNNSKCKLHERRIQFASEQTIAKLGLEVTAVTRGRVDEAVTANGEIGFD